MPERREGGSAWKLQHEEPGDYFLSGGGEYMGIGNCETLAPPPSSAVILLTPCFFTSSMRRMECRADTYV